MRQPATRELFNYWNNLRGQRAAPDRAEIEPAAIRNVLTDTFMLDIDFEHQFPVRLSGSRMNALFCAEVKKRSFLDLWSRSEAHNIAAMLLTVVDAACPVVTSATAAPTGYAELDLEILFLPLRHGGDVNARILGSFSTTGRPAWLGLLPVERLKLGAMRTVKDGIPGLKSATMSEPIRTFAAPPPLGAEFERRGHLRVFRGGR